MQRLIEYYAKIYSRSIILSQGFKAEIAKEGLLGLVDATDEFSRGVVEKLLEGDFEGADAANEEGRADRLIAILLLEASSI